MITLDDIELPEDLVWTGEFNQSLVKHNIIYTVTGALIVQYGVQQAGGVITLSGYIDSAWIKRGLLKTLHALQESNVEMTLTLHDARVFNVIFDYQRNGITAKPIIDFNTPDDADEYQIVIPLIEV